MGTKTMRFREWSGVLLCVHGSTDLQPEEWAAYVDYCLQLPASCNKALIVTDGGGPNAAQRRALQDRYLSKQKEYRVAVMTDSSVVRGIVTALSWFNPDIRAFPYDDGRSLPAAMSYLGLNLDMGSRLRLELQMMRRELGLGPET
jgi:hypothetical protein